MLQPKIKIFIAYGHDHEIRDAIKTALEELARNKHYRYTVVVIDSGFIRNREGVVRGQVHSTLKDLQKTDAAIVLLTGDNLAISKETLKNLNLDENKIQLSSTELIKRMDTWAGQNVIYELGHLEATIGLNRYYVLAEKSVTPPTNIGDILLTDINELKSDKSKLHSIIKDFIEVKLKLVPEPLPLWKSDAVIDYSNLYKEGQKLSDDELLDKFEKEYNELDSIEDKVLFLYERIVFDSYFQNSLWWRKLIDRFGKLKQTRVTPLVKGLRLIQDYISFWRPPEIQDISRIIRISEDFKQIINENKIMDKVNPVVRMVLYDYYGLCMHKKGISEKIEGKREIAILSLKESNESLERVVKLSNDFESDAIPLWRGYASFNRARVLREMNEISSEEVEDTIWQKAFEEAIYHRNRWWHPIPNFPDRLTDGLRTEYMHARVQRISMEKDKETAERLKKELEPYILEWRESPSIKLIRLSGNVMSAWQKINS